MSITPSPNGDMQEIATQIRYWVHYDTTLANLNKQARQIRDARAATEDRVLALFGSAHLSNPVIQIVGGRIVVVNEKHMEPLNFKTLETHLHQYFREKHGAGKDETKDILKFIKDQRQVTSSASLKRIMNTGGAAVGADTPPQKV